jgi:hypothetical protein
MREIGERGRLLKFSWNDSAARIYRNKIYSLQIEFWQALLCMANHLGDLNLIVGRQDREGFVSSFNSPTSFLIVILAPAPFPTGRYFP